VVECSTVLPLGFIVSLRWLFARAVELRHGSAQDPCREIQYNRRSSTTLCDGVMLCEEDNTWLRFVEVKHFVLASKHSHGSRRLAKRI